MSLDRTDPASTVRPKTVESSTSGTAFNIFLHRAAMANHAKRAFAMVMPGCAHCVAVGVDDAMVMRELEEFRALAAGVLDTIVIVTETPEMEGAIAKVEIESGRRTKKRVLQQNGQWYEEERQPRMDRREFAVMQEFSMIVTTVNRYRHLQEPTDLFLNIGEFSLGFKSDIGITDANYEGLHPMHIHDALRSIDPTTPLTWRICTYPDREQVLKNSAQESLEPFRDGFCMQLIQKEKPANYHQLLAILVSHGWSPVTEDRLVAILFALGTLVEAQTIYLDEKRFIRNFLIPLTRAEEMSNVQHAAHMLLTRFQAEPVMREPAKKRHDVRRLFLRLFGEGAHVSYHPDRIWTVKDLCALAENSENPVDVFTTYLHCVRSNEPAHVRRIVRWLAKAQFMCPEVRHLANQVLAGFDTMPNTGWLHMQAENVCEREEEMGDDGGEPHHLTTAQYEAHLQDARTADHGCDELFDTFPAPQVTFSQFDIAYAEEQQKAMQQVCRKIEENDFLGTTFYLLLPTSRQALIFHAEDTMLDVMKALGQYDAYELRGGKLTIASQPTYFHVRPTPQSFDDGVLEAMRAISLEKYVDYLITQVRQHLSLDPGPFVYFYRPESAVAYAMAAEGTHREMVTRLLPLARHDDLMFSTDCMEQFERIEYQGALFSDVEFRKLDVLRRNTEPR